MFILSDGKSYVMENPMKHGKYLRTTSPVQAKEFTFKQARGLVQSKKQSLEWIKTYQIINKDTGKIVEDVPRYSNEGVYCDENAYEFDFSVVKTIREEVDSIIGLAAWDLNQLNTYLAILETGMSYYDSAISDIKHARLDKRPPAHVRTKIDGIMNELEESRRDVKQVRSFVKILIEANNKQWTIGRIKAELAQAKYVPYKGRTKYFEIVNNLLAEY